MNQIHDKKHFLKTVQVVASLVGSTAGPWGANVQCFDGTNPVTFRDGLKVLEHFVPISDSMMHNVTLRMQQRAQRIQKVAGDGTTTTTLLMAAIYEEAEMLSGGKTSRRAIANGIRKAVRDASTYLATITTAVTSLEQLRAIATIAAGGDVVIGDLMATMIHEIGVDGVVTVEYDNVEALKAERMEGFMLKGGAMHESFITGRNGKTILENPYILVVGEATQWSDVMPFVGAWHQRFISEARPLVIVADKLEGSAATTLQKRKDAHGNTLPIFCVKVDYTKGGDSSDLAAIVGAKEFSKKSAAMFQDFKGDMGDFGVAKKVVIDMKQTVFFSDADVTARENELKALLDAASDKDMIHGRLANLRNKVGIVKIPVITSGASTFLKEVVEDSYMACRAALKDGSLPGAGKALLLVSDALDDDKKDIGRMAVKNACDAVFNQLLSNGGVEIETIRAMAQRLLYGSNTNDTICLDDDTLNRLLAGDVNKVKIEASDKSGVIDAATAVIAALENAGDEAAEWVETVNIILP